MALHRSLAGHEDAVVGLGVVARHAVLVALAVVDVHVQLATVDERLEVEHRVVAVENDLGVQLGVELRQLGERRRGKDGQGRGGPQQPDGVVIAGNDPDRMTLVEQLQDGQPLDAAGRGACGRPRSRR